MTAITVQPIVLKDSTMTIDEDDFEKHLSGVTFTPDAKPVTWKGLGKGSSFTGMPEATWTCTLDYAQDWATSGSLSQYLLANEGKSVTAMFTPASGQGSFTATIIITPGAIGGQVDNVATASVTLGSTKPEFTAPTTP